MEGRERIREVEELKNTPGLESGGKVKVEMKKSRQIHEAVKNVRRGSLIWFNYDGLVMCGFRHEMIDHGEKPMGMFI